MRMNVLGATGGQIIGRRCIAKVSMSILGSGAWIISRSVRNGHTYFCNTTSVGSSGTVRISVRGENTLEAPGTTGDFSKLWKDCLRKLQIRIILNYFSMNLKPSFNISRVWMKNLKRWKVLRIFSNFGRKFNRKSECYLSLIEIERKEIRSFSTTKFPILGGVPYAPAPCLRAQNEEILAKIKVKNNMFKLWKMFLNELWMYQVSSHLKTGLRAVNITFRVELIYWI